MALPPLISHFSQGLNSLNLPALSTSISLFWKYVFFFISTDTKDKWAWLSTPTHSPPHSAQIFPWAAPWCYPSDGWIKRVSLVIIRGHEHWSSGECWRSRLHLRDRTSIRTFKLFFFCSLTNRLHTTTVEIPYCGWFCFFLWLPYAYFDIRI